MFTRKGLQRPLAPVDTDSISFSKGPFQGSPSGCIEATGQVRDAAKQLKVAQGSGAVAMITVSAIMAPLVIDTPPGFHPVYVACAIGSGSLVGSWMNDSGFWVYKQMSGLTETEALQTWTPLLAGMGLVGYVAAQIAAVLLPLV